ncbi:hypothetical protein A7U60_g4165 [Sanghuangporus baumii]|uniref:Protein-S-isoprenylcysteine O-methyltransferase n=1 Tax=Sanghuangporus baumii TaxID=108892 RepID=A0A9Q5HZ50_SANBA|nr:hypothetical protein A7U60_g4165 [Sanghuangporus baumii]
MILLPATSKHILVISAFMDAMVQLIFVRRAWFLSNKNRIITGSLIPAVLSQFVVKLVFYGRIYRFTQAFQLFDVVHLELALNYVVAVADAYIAGVLIWLLWKGRSGIKKTDSLINRLVLYTVSSSLVTAVWEVAAVIGAEVAPHSFIYLLADMVLPKLYFNCMLASLNARTSLRENLGNEVGVMSIRFQNVSMVSTEQSETPTITPHKAKTTRGFGLEADIDIESGIDRRRSDAGYEMSRRSFPDATNPSVTHHAACTAPTIGSDPTDGAKRSEDGEESMSHDRYAFAVKPFLGLLSLSKYSMWTFICLDGASRVLSILRPSKLYAFLSPIVWTTAHGPAPDISHQSVPALPSSFLMGASLVILGWRLRKACFDALGKQFTLTHKMYQKHSLVTTGPYSFVRHPGYIGILFVRIGGLCVLLSHGSWARSVGAVPWPFRRILEHSFPGSADSLVVQVGRAAIGLYAVHAALELIGLFCVRAPHEDAMLRERFGSEWETYKGKVPWMFVPYVL